MPLYKLSIKFNIINPYFQKSSSSKQMLLELIPDANQTTYSGYILCLQKGADSTLFSRINHPDAKFICSETTFKTSADKPPGYLTDLSPDMLKQLGTVTPMTPEILLANNGAELNKYACLQEMFAAATKTNPNWVNFLYQPHPTLPNQVEPPTFLKITISKTNKHFPFLKLVKNEGNDQGGEAQLKLKLCDNIKNLIKTLTSKTMQETLQEQQQQMALVTQLKESSVEIKDVQFEKINLEKIIFFQGLPILFKEDSADQSGDTTIIPLSSIQYPVLLLKLAQIHTSNTHKASPLSNADIEKILENIFISYNAAAQTIKEQLDKKDKLFSKKILSSPNFAENPFKIDQAVIGEVLFNKITLPVKLVVLISSNENNKLDLFILSSIGIQLPNTDRHSFFLQVHQYIVKWLREKLALELASANVHPTAHNTKIVDLQNLIHAIKTNKSAALNDAPQINQNIVFYNNVNYIFMQEGDQLTAITNDSLLDITDQLFTEYTAKLHRAQTLENAETLSIVKNQNTILAYFDSIYAAIKAQLETSNNAIPSPYKFNNEMLSYFLERKHQGNEKITFRIIHVNHPSQSQHLFIPGHTFCVIAKNEKPIEFLAIFSSVTSSIKSKITFTNLISSSAKDELFFQTKETSSWVMLNENLFFNLFLFFKNVNATIHIFHNANARAAIPIPQINPPQLLQPVPQQPSQNSKEKLYLETIKQLKRENNILRTQLINFNTVLQLRYEHDLQPLSVNFSSQQDALDSSLGVIIDFLINSMISLELELDGKYITDALKLNHLINILLAIQTRTLENAVESIRGNINTALSNLNLPLLEQPWVAEEEKQLEYEVIKWILYLFNCMTLPYQDLDQAIKKGFEAFAKINSEDLQVNFRLSLHNLLGKKIAAIYQKINNIQIESENKFHHRLEKLKKEEREIKLKNNMTDQLKEQEVQLIQMQTKLEQAQITARQLSNHVNNTEEMAPDPLKTRTLCKQLSEQLAVNIAVNKNDDATIQDSTHLMECASVAKEATNLLSEMTIPFSSEEREISEFLIQLPRDEKKQATAGKENKSERSKRGSSSISSLRQNSAFNPDAKSVERNKNEESDTEKNKNEESVSDSEKNSASEEKLAKKRKWK